MIEEVNLEMLKLKHAKLEAAIYEEEHHPWVDFLRLHDLKKEKLRIKEIIEELH